MNKVVLCVAAHPDDEALGCGGTLARHVIEGDAVHVIYLADGVTSCPGATAADVLEREAMAGKATSHLGIPFSNLHFLDFPDQRLDKFSALDIIQAVERVVADIGLVDIVYTHSLRDLNRDHRITHDVVMTVFRPKPGSTVHAIRCFEVPSATDWAFDQSRTFSPNTFMDIAGTPVERKFAALAAYSREMPAYPHARSFMAIDALMRWRGASVGLGCVEAFQTMRQII